MGSPAYELWNLINYNIAQSTYPLFLHFILPMYKLIKKNTSMALSSLWIFCSSNNYSLRSNIVVVLSLVFFMSIFKMDNDNEPRDIKYCMNLLSY
jgi:hypothetical protein